MFPLPRRDRDALHTSAPEFWRSNESQKAVGEANPQVLSYLSGVFCRVTEMGWRMEPQITEVDFSIVSRGEFLRSVRFGVVERLSFNGMITSR